MTLRSIPLVVALLIAGLALLPGCSEKPPGKELLVYTAKQGSVLMHYEDLVEGQGDPVKKLDKIEVHYTGWLESGKKFDSSRDKDTPLELVIGLGQVIPGWDEGIIGMKVGGKRKLYIPSKLGYGEQGRPPIPPNAPLIFEVELLHIFPAIPPTPPKKEGKAP